MAAFGGFTMTNRGRALQSKAQAGTQLVYTKAVIGDGSLTSQSIVTLTALISPKMTLPITGVRPAPPDRAYVESKFNNQGITTGFYFREVGVFAQDPDLGEILYAYANAGQNAEYIPPTGGTDIVEKSIRMNVFVGSAANITATIDSSLVFPTYDQVEEMLAAIQVELTQNYNSTDPDVAISGDAVRRGLETKQNILRLADNYLSASVLVNAAPDPNTGRAYPDGVSMFKVTSVAGGWPAANGYVLTFRAGSGGYQIFYEMYTGAVQTDKTARQWTRSKRDLNAFWQDWARGMTEVDMTAHANDHIRHPLYAPNPTGTGTLYTVQTNPAEGISTIPDGFGLVLVPNVANTGAASVKIDTATTVPLNTADGTDFAIGELLAGIPVTFRKVGANFIASNSGGGRVNGQEIQTIKYGEAINRGDMVRLELNYDIQELPGPASNFANAQSVSVYGDYVAVGSFGQSPYLIIYKRVDGVLVKLPNPGVMPVAGVSAVKFSPDGKFLVVGVNSTSSYITIYRRDGDTFTRLASPATMPTFYPIEISFSPDSAYLVMARDSSRVWYKISGDTFTSIVYNTTSFNGYPFFVSNTELLGVYSTSGLISITLNRANDTFVTKVINGVNVYNNQGLRPSTDGKYSLGPGGPQGTSNSGRLVAWERINGDYREIGSFVTSAQMGGPYNFFRFINDDYGVATWSSIVAAPGVQLWRRKGNEWSNVLQNIGEDRRNYQEIDLSPDGKIMLTAGRVLDNSGQVIPGTVGFKEFALNPHLVAYKVPTVDDNAKNNLVKAYGYAKESGAAGDSRKVVVLSK